MKGARSFFFLSASPAEFQTGVGRIGKKHIEHYWGGLERSWNGFLLDSVETVLKRAGNFIWRGIKTQVDIVFGTYKTGIMHLPKEKKEIEERLLRVPELRWWDVSIPFRPKTVNQ